MSSAASEQPSRKTACGLPTNGTIIGRTTAYPKYVMLMTRLEAQS